jgi:hypothetical protein
MAVITSTGTLFAVVAAEPATVDAAGFGALTFVNVGELTDLPEYGANAEVVTHNPLATGITEKYKGFINKGSMSLSLGRDADDAGQQILAGGVTGINKNAEHSFRVTYQDGSIDYFTGKIFSYTKAPGGANSIVGSTVQVEINSVIVEV